MKALDLFCSAGGATKGLQRAGFHVTGVDLAFQPRYCGDVFIRADALRPPVDLAGFDLIWASPPCQSYSDAMKHLAIPQPMLIEPVRKMLSASGRRWVIENVAGAPLADPLVLCGTAFGMRVHRHRLFESNFLSCLVPACDRSVSALNPHNADGRERMYAELGRGCPEKRWGREMGIDWMNRHETREAIPPAYAEFIGLQAVRAVRVMEAAQ